MHTEGLPMDGRGRRVQSLIMNSATFREPCHKGLPMDGRGRRVRSHALIRLLEVVVKSEADQVESVGGEASVPPSTVLVCKRGFRA